MHLDFARAGYCSPPGLILIFGFDRGSCTMLVSISILHFDTKKSALPYVTNVSFVTQIKVIFSPLKFYIFWQFYSNNDKPVYKDNVINKVSSFCMH